MKENFQKDIAKYEYPNKPFEFQIIECKNEGVVANHTKSFFDNLTKSVGGEVQTSITKVKNLIDSHVKIYLENLHYNSLSMLFSLREIMFSFI